MNHRNPGIVRLVIVGVIIILLSSLANACQSAPTSAVPNIDDIVATGRAGTQHAWALGTIVSATRSALTGQAKTPPPPPGASEPAPPSPVLPAVNSPDPFSGDPCTDKGPGKLSYADEKERFCLFYPDNFFVNKPSTGIVEFLGPALDSSTQPLRAYISISRKERVSGRTLDEIAMQIWAEPRSAFRMSNIQLGGRDALVAEDLLIGESDWKVIQIVFTHSNYVYLISLSPVDSAPPFDKALPDIQRFWDLAISSFKFQ